MDSCMAEAEDMFDDEWNMLEEVDKADDFVRDVLQYFGYADDFIDLCDEENYGTEIGLAKTLSFLKLRYPDKLTIRYTDVSAHYKVCVIRCS